MSSNPEFAVKCFAIPHDQQRYPTVGDWEDYMGNITIRVSEMDDPRYMQLVTLHELVECLLCRWTNISGDRVDNFDQGFDPISFGDEPGDDRNAPYHAQHTIASVVERLAADLLGVDWNEYTRSVEVL